MRMYICMHSKILKIICEKREGGDGVQSVMHVYLLWKHCYLLFSSTFRSCFSKIHHETDFCCRTVCSFELPGNCVKSHSIK